MGTLGSSVSGFAHAVLDFLLPHMCLLCESETTDGLICNNCLDYLPVVTSPICHRCGRPVTRGNTCRWCKRVSVLDHGRAWMLFVPPSDKLIHHFKYRKKTKLASLLGRAMSTLIRTDHKLKEADLLIPVPLFWWKKLRRGYNQAVLLTHVIQQETSIKEQDTMRRIKNTKTQTRLTEHERCDNVKNAFTVHTNGIKDKKILLIDDVLTTGATIHECARVLKAAGAREVYSCVAAITPE